MQDSVNVTKEQKSGADPESITNVHRRTWNTIPVALLVTQYPRAMDSVCEACLSPNHRLSPAREILSCRNIQVTVSCATKSNIE